jgi:hypothetical protein
VAVTGEVKMELGTFGAVMAFASEVVAQSVAFCESAGSLAWGSDLQAILRSLADEGRRDRATIEQARRENVTEMILEPIAGLHRQEYRVDTEEPEAGADAAIVRTALLLAERDHRFFIDSSAKLPLPEVARIFRRVAHRKERELARLRALTS